MINVAIVEDDRGAATLLGEYLRRFTEEHGTQFNVRVFENGINFLTNYRGDYQIIFMDIEMPHMDGMETARQLRKIDPVAALVFITNMAQFAIRGYEVDAMDFVLKPVTYYRFSALLQKLTRRLDARREYELTIRTPSGINRVYASRVSHITVEDHLLLFHVGEEIIESWGSLKNALDGLPEGSFLQVNKSCIVNLRHVRGIEGNDLLVGDSHIPLSRGRKQAVLTALNQYLER